MSVHGKTIDRISSFVIYLILVLFVINAGSRAVNYSVDTHFYYYYLMKWESCLTKFNSKGKTFPVLSNKNYVGYMESLIQLLRRNSIPVPVSNTNKPYIYKINKTGFSKTQKIFLLCFGKKIILYGLSKTTFNMLDKLIDERYDNKSGRFTGKLQKDKIHYAGIWNL